MGYLRVEDVAVKGLSVALPKNEETNSDLGLMTKKEQAKFEKTVGILRRRVAPREMTASDLCVGAAERLLEVTGVSPADIGVLIFVSQTPDHTVPGSASQIQFRLGIPTTALAMDINQGCAGYVYGLGTIASLLASSASQYALLLVGDTITHTLSPTDKSTRPIFSDAGSATLLERKSGAAAMHFQLQSDGKGYQAIHIPHGGTRFPLAPTSFEVKVQEGGLERAACHLEMRGLEVFHFALKEVAPNIHRLMEAAGANLDEVDRFVFHQANLLLNESIRKKLRLPAEKVPYTLAHFGNTSSGTVPVTLVDQVLLSNPTAHRKLCLSGFGVGLSWGSALLETADLIVPPILEMS